MPKLLTAAVLTVFWLAAASREASAAPRKQSRSSLQKVVDAAAREALSRFAAQGLKDSNLAITLVDLTDPARPGQASFRGDEPFYPASVVKMFYLVAVHRWLEDGKLQRTDELDAALRDMIVDSSNDATHHIVDLLTGTTAGPALPPDEMARWSEQRNVINRYFAGLGYRHININQKTWCEGPYGRERAFLGPARENRNRLTTNATARLLVEIVTGQAVSRTRSTAMMALLARDLAATSQDPDDETHGFTGKVLTSGARLWSKAGWTSTARHDAAYIELPDGLRFVLVTFTSDVSQERAIIPTVASAVIEGLKQRRGARAR